MFPGLCFEAKSNSHRLMPQDKIIGGNCDLRKEKSPFQINWPLIHSLNFEITVECFASMPKMGSESRITTRMIE